MRYRKNPVESAMMATKKTKQGVTYHHACDCREAKFAAIEQENATLRALAVALTDAATVVLQIAKDDDWPAALTGRQLAISGLEAALANVKEVTG